MDIDPSNWMPKLKDDHQQWDEFTSLQGVKKIISFGGWSFSTDPATYNLLRQAMSPQNRIAFANNIANFLVDQGLDGVDFDWEYPGATDIDGTPPGSPSDGPNYLKFLWTMKDALARGSHDKSVSIAAPASYWYLKAFPIQKMAEVVDYIVYMTYDLHGQWDAGNQYSMDGCPAGNCLRSHVNLTETTAALAMITKAGVPSTKIYVGEASYGRSFKMSKAGCVDPMCTFEGDRYNSEAMPGVCTGTEGYLSNAEINRIQSVQSNVRTWHDHSNSDIMVYDDTEWVAYMTTTTKNTRRKHWKNHQFAGTIDWAVDLQEFTSDDDYGGSGDDEKDEFDGSTPPSSCDGSYNTLEAIEADKDKMEDHCRDEYMLQVLQKMLEDSLKTHDTLLANNYDHYFDLYAEAVVHSSGKAVKDFMYKHGNDYFSCIVTETYHGCDHCRAINTNPETVDRSCRYCENYDCGAASGCVPGKVDLCQLHHSFRYRNISMPCPPDYAMRSSGRPDDDSPPQQATYWTMLEGKSDSFYADLYKGVGIDNEHIKWKDVQQYPTEKNDASYSHQFWDYNFPVVDNYREKDVANPKEIIDKGRSNLNSMGPDLASVLEQIKKQSYGGFVGDLVDALAMPIILVEQAVASMKTVNDIGEHIDEEKRKAIIIGFLTALLFFVPFVGELAGTFVAMAGVSRILTIVGAVGNAALDIYSVVDSKGNDPLAILSLVLAPAAIFDVARIGKAATIRRGAQETEVAKLGKETKARLDMIDRIKGRTTCALQKRDWKDKTALGGMPLPTSNLATRW
ncbi:hypothetical protein RJ55_03946 [Drechmeria coniospora]|nr:hypothetical protein RJ55_03946 [Drechmeria coniospora]